MMTTRGWWLILPMLALALLGVLYSHGALSLLGAAVVVWFCGEWLLFAVRARLRTRLLRVRRMIVGDSGPATILWAGQTYRVELTLTSTASRPLPYLLLADRFSLGVELLEGSTLYDGTLPPGESLALSYRIRCPAAGVVRFAPPLLQLADPQGFFFHRTAVGSEQSFRVLPGLVDSRGHPTAVKRFNLLPPPGTHRVRRPGSSSELHDLRDYLPGDPPKMIAWKISARRDRLITKEFETEAPVRCMLFVDTSQSVRVGSLGRSALTRIIAIAAAVAQAATAARDLTGLCLVNETNSAYYVPPARGRRHLVNLFDHLAEAASLEPTPSALDWTQLLPLAYGLAKAIAPDAFRAEVNDCPFWLPLLFPQPLSTRALRKRGDFLFRWLPFLSGRRRGLYRWRKKLAAFLAVRHNLPLGSLAALLEDDVEFTRHLQLLLADYQVPIDIGLYDANGRYRFASPRKIEVLAQALLRSVRQGRDNELYVLLVDCLESTDHLEPLLSAVRVARGRHHRLVVICPWPPGVPPPERTAAAEALNLLSADFDDHSIATLLEKASIARLHQAFADIRRPFAALGVPVLCAESGDPVGLVLERLDRLRVLGRSL